MSEEITILGADGSKTQMDYHPNLTIGDIKVFYFQKYGIPDETYNFEKNGLTLSENMTLEHLNIYQGDRIKVSLTGKKPSFPFDPEKLLTCYLGRTLTAEDKVKLKNPTIVYALNLLHDGIEKAEEAELYIRLPKFINKSSAEHPREEMKKEYDQAQKIKKPNHSTPPSPKSSPSTPRPTPGAPSPSPSDMPDLGDMYAEQIQTLKDMGFNQDNDELIALLLEKQTVENVVEYLISKM